MSKTKHYETTLPEGYVLVKHVDVQNDRQTAMRYMLSAYLPPLVITPLLCVLAAVCNGYNILANWGADRVWLVILVALLANYAYVPLHELTHGITYKCFTGGKLTFGYMVTAAFCGVPSLYVRKKASVTALIMPFIVFSILFTGLTVGLWFVKPLYGIGAGLLLALHIGGCTGDLRWLKAYRTQFRHCDPLRRDSGPEQWLYISQADAEKYGIAVISE